tara:strand:+ start:2003 stop:2467 length:465 start_codon:yes stop_codon:yes gene_type:complete
MSTTNPETITYVDMKDNNRKLIVEKDTNGNKVTVEFQEGNAGQSQGNDQSITVTPVDEDKIKQIIKEKNSDITAVVGDENVQVDIVYNEYTKNMNPDNIPSELENSIRKILNTKESSENKGGKAKRSKKSAKKGKKSKGKKGKRAKKSAKKGKK